MLSQAEARKKLNLTPEQIEKMAKPYEEGTYTHEEGSLFIGSHLDAVEKKRISVVFDAKDTQQVNKLAEIQGVTPSVIYRQAVRFYLSSVNNSEHTREKLTARAQ